MFLKEVENNLVFYLYLIVVSVKKRRRLIRRSPFVLSECVCNAHKANIKMSRISINQKTLPKLKGHKHKRCIMITSVILICYMDANSLQRLNPVPLPTLMMNRIWRFHKHNVAATRIK